LNVLAEDALVLSTSVLQTGANLPPVTLVLLLGHAYSLEALLQAAGRAARSASEQGHAFLLSTPFAIEDALRIGKNAQGLLDVRDIIQKVSQGEDLQKALADWFDPSEILRSCYDERPVQAQQQYQELPPQQPQKLDGRASNADVLTVQRALQVVFNVLL
jgi:superfamily II DNA or RNA helicase